MQWNAVEPVRIDIWDFSDQSHKASNLFGMLYPSILERKNIKDHLVQDQFQHFRMGLGNVPCWTLIWMLVAIELLYLEMDVGGLLGDRSNGSFHLGLSPSYLHSKMCCRRHFLILVLLWPSRPWCFAITVPFSVSFVVLTCVDLAAATSNVRNWGHVLTCVDHVESSGEIREGQKLAVGDAQGHLHIQNIPKRLGSRAKLRCHRITSAVKDGNYVNVCVGPAFVQPSQPSKRCL